MPPLENEIERINFKLYSVKYMGDIEDGSGRKSIGILSRK